MKMVTCTTLYGKEKIVPANTLRIRPSAYGIIVHEARALLTQLRHTGHWHPPGGGLEKGETLAEAVIREVREETGIVVDVGESLGFREHFFYYDPLDSALQGLLFFFACTPLTFDLLPDDQIDDGEVGHVAWVPVESLKESDFATHGALILQLLRR